MDVDKISSAIAYFISGLCMLFLFSLILALPLLWLWNATMPELFGMKEISWWMAWKLMLLSSIVFNNLFSFEKKS
jgi:uncharacterized membrane protein required for colicin V production